MKNIKEMTSEERLSMIMELYDQLTPENKARARALTHQLYLEEQASVDNKGGRPQKLIKKTTIPPVHVNYYTIAEATALLGVHRHTLQARLRDGRIRGKLIGRSWRIYADELFDNSTHYYYFNCEDDKFGGRLFTASQLNKITNDADTPLPESQIIDLAKSLEAIVYRCNKEPDGLYTNEERICNFERR